MNTLFNIQEIYQEFSKLFDRVEEFLKTVKREDYIHDGYLRHFNSLEPYEDEILPEGLTQEYIDLLGQLDLEVCAMFINNNGHNTYHFSTIRSYGFITRVLERDDFGPLCCGVKRNDLDWMITYG